MKVVVVGVKGWSGSMGGIETHARRLYPLLAARGHEIHIVTLRFDSGENDCQRSNNLNVIPVWCPFIGAMSTFWLTVLGAFYAVLSRPDLFHIHSIGPANVAPLARLFGLKVVVTHHGRDYEAEKWAGFSRLILRVGEWLGMRFANKVIVVSNFLYEHVKGQFGVHAAIIPNGVEPPISFTSCSTLDELKLLRKRYVIEVARMTPHKGQDDLIRAFLKAELPGWKLVLVGDAEKGEHYGVKVTALAKRTPNVVLAGPREGSQLWELLAHAGVFALPSSYEGNPIAVLEALSYGLPVILSDIPAHLELNLGPEHYYRLGDTESLTDRISYFANAKVKSSYLRKIETMLKARYNWSVIADSTHEVYLSV